MLCQAMIFIAVSPAFSLTAETAEERRRVVWVLLAFACSAFSRRMTVDDDGPADFGNIQGAINAGDEGNEIAVADGAYTGDSNHNIDFLGKEPSPRPWTLTVPGGAGDDRGVDCCEE